MLIKAVEELVEGDRFKFGLHEFVVRNVSTKIENTDRTDPDFMDVVVLARSVDGEHEMDGFFSEGIKIEVVGNSQS